MKLLKKVPAYRLIMQPLPGESTKPPAPASPLKALAESSDIIEYALAIFITQHWRIRGLCSGNVHGLKWF
jgi:hypothetical protein